MTFPPPPQDNPINQNSGQGGQFGSPPGGGSFGWPLGGPAAGPPPPNYLPWAIACALLCCQIPGIVAIVYAAQVNSSYFAGNYAAARESSAKALLWIKWSVGLGVSGVLLYIIAVVFFGVLGSVNSAGV